MAIDSSLWVADLPSGTYNVGDVVELKCVDGPVNVRSGRGRAVLKNIFVASFNGANYWRIHVKNSDWIDEVISFTNPFNNDLVLDPQSGCSQDCHDCALMPNSSWQIYAECIQTGAAADNSIFALIDIDYPDVSAVEDPTKAVGYPTSLDYDVTVPTYAYGAMSSAAWVGQSVDYFKAGYRYVLDRVESFGTAVVGFIAFSNAAGMGGLQRIVPFTHHINGPRFSIKYSSALVKGPMEIKVKAFTTSAGSQTIHFVHDYVKRVG